MGERMRAGAPWHWISKDDPQDGLFREAEAARVDEAKRAAKAHGREVLTSATAEHLLRVTSDDVRISLDRGDVEVVFPPDSAGEPLLGLQSVLSHWSQDKRPAFDSVLESLRRNGTTRVVSGRIYNVLQAGEDAV